MTGPGTAGGTRLLLVRHGPAQVNVDARLSSRAPGSPFDRARTLAGGENGQDLVDRAGEVLDLVRDRHAGRTVVAVTHGGFISARSERPDTRTG
jgi:broad specificity phosphatase PhoE